MALNATRAIWDIYATRCFVGRGRTGRRSWAAAYIFGTLLAIVLTPATLATLDAPILALPGAVPTPTDTWRLAAGLLTVELTHRVCLLPVFTTAYRRRRRDAHRPGTTALALYLPLVWLIILPITALSDASYAELPTDPEEPEWTEINTDDGADDAYGDEDEVNLYGGNLAGRTQ